MKREEVIAEIGTPILRPLGFIQMFCLLAFLSTPFVWLWDSWYLAWRVGLTGFVGFLIALVVYRFIEVAVKEVVNQELDKMDKEPMTEPKKSGFRDRLEKATKAKSEALKNT